MIQQKSYEEVLNDFMKKKINWTWYTEAMHTFWMSCYKIGYFFVKIEKF